MLSWKLRAAFAALVTAAPLAAQDSFDVLLVDAANPAYDTIQEVVDLAPLNSIILIPPGDYSNEAVTIDNKTLAFLRYDPSGTGGNVKVGNWTIQNLGGPRRVVLRGLRFVRNTAFQSNLTVTNNSGALFVEDCRFEAVLPPLFIPPGQAVPAVSLAGADPLDPALAHFVRCEIDGIDGTASSQLGQDRIAGEALYAEFHELTVYECTAIGGTGASGQDGAPGAKLRGSNLHLSGGSLVGGDGGIATGTPCQGGDGGPGIAGADQAGDPVSVASFVGLPVIPLAGGLGGTGSGSCTSGVDGPPATLASAPVGLATWASTISTPELIWDQQTNVPLDFAPTSGSGGPFALFWLYGSRALDFAPGLDPQGYGFPVLSVAVIGAIESNTLLSAATSPHLFNLNPLVLAEGEARIVFLQGQFWVPSPLFGSWSAPTVIIVLDPNFDPEVNPTP